MNNYITGHIRTLVPVAVGYAVTLLAREYGVVVDSATSTSVSLALAGALTAAYYVAVRWVGQRFPAAEHLLGTKATPTY